jgi:hypothetical protein
MALRLHVVLRLAVLAHSTICLVTGMCAAWLPEKVLLRLRRVHVRLGVVLGSVCLLLMLSIDGLL